MTLYLGPCTHAESSIYPYKLDRSSYEATVTAALAVVKSSNLLLLSTLQKLPALNNCKLYSRTAFIMRQEDGNGETKIGAICDWVTPVFNN
jgi:hypothetical protein